MSTSDINEHNAVRLIVTVDEHVYFDLTKCCNTEEEWAELRTKIANCTLKDIASFSAGYAKKETNHG